jgi:hypothetical protein
MVLALGRRLEIGFFRKNPISGASCWVGLLSQADPREEGLLRHDFEDQQRDNADHGEAAIDAFGVVVPTKRRSGFRRGGGFWSGGSWSGGHGTLGGSANCSNNTGFNSDRLPHQPRRTRVPATNAPPQQTAAIAPNRKNAPADFQPPPLSGELNSAITPNMSIVAAANPKSSAKISNSVAVMIEPALEPAFFRAMDCSEQQNPPRLMIDAEVGSAEVEADRTWDPVGRHTAKPARLRCLEADACQGN